MNKRPQKEFWQLLSKRAKKRRFIGCGSIRGNGIRENASGMCPVCAVATELKHPVKEMDNYLAIDIGFEMGFDAYFIKNVILAADLNYDAGDRVCIKLRKKLESVCRIGEGK